jgi:RNA polymerase sigma-70 factor (ECF subfamily)
MGDQPRRSQQRPDDSDVSLPVDETLRAVRTFDVVIEDVVPVARGRGALVDDIVHAAWRTHERELFSYALRATKDREVAADLVQDCFLRLVSELRAGRRPAQIRPWLYRVLTNQVISRSRHRSVVDRWLRNLRPREESAPSPEGAAIAGETRSALEQAIAHLAPDARVAVLLAARGFSGADIAIQLGRSELATRTLLCRARVQVRDLLEEAGDDA